MGFIKPSLPDLDLQEWGEKPRMERVKPMIQEWAQSGFGAPDAVLVLYAVKIALYVGGALFFASITPGVGSLGDLEAWWTEPIVFQKVVVFTLLFEILGFGCGFGPLTLRFLPPIGAFLHWLRPGTIRLPPWPDHIPGTRGTGRGLIDVLLYAAVIGSALWALLSDGVADGPVSGAAGVLPPTPLVAMLGFLALIGLRDKTIFLAARTEVYGAFVLTFFLSDVDMIVAAQLVMVLIWWGAATSKLNQHFPYVVATMSSNSPVLRLKAVKRLFHRSWPDDIRPSGLSGALAHGGTVIEFVVPLVLLLSDGGVVTNVAAVVMLLFHLHILTSLPMGVPLEWNVFMMFGIGVLFVDYADQGLGDLTDPLLVVLVVLPSVVLVVLGNLYPEKISFLMSMRYYAGNWATSMWCLKPSAIAKIDAYVVKSSQLPLDQLTRLYGAEMAWVMLHKGYAFRAMHTHGRALFGLIPRAAGPLHEVDYIPMDGEFVAGATIGWNFGEGHLHNEQLLAALHERCAFEEGEVRIIVVESQQFWRPVQLYRLVDAVTGEFERGEIAVQDLIDRQPWDTDIPTHVVEPRPVTERGVTNA